LNVSVVELLREEIAPLESRKVPYENLSKCQQVFHTLISIDYLVLVFCILSIEILVVVEGQESGCRAGAETNFSKGLG
jgi:hypothetical protein